MGEPISAQTPQSNGGVKQKPTSLNLALGSGYYRNANGRVSLNDLHLQQQIVDGRISGSGRIKSISPNPPTDNESTKHNQLPSLPPTSSSLSAVTGWNLLVDREDLLESQPPPPPAPSNRPACLRSAIVNNNEHQYVPSNTHYPSQPAEEQKKTCQQQQQQQQIAQPQARSSRQSSPIGQLSAPSPNHNGYGFTLYTPPAPIPASGPNKVRPALNGLPQPPVRRPHSIAAPTYSINSQQQYAYGQFNGRPTIPQSSSSTSISATTSATPTSATWSNGPEVTFNTTTAQNSPYAVPRRSQSVASTPVSSSPVVAQPKCQEQTTQSTATIRTAQSTSNHWNGQSLPRRPHSIATTPVSGPATTSSAQLQWGASGMVLHQPIPRRAYASTLPHPQPPTPISQGGVGLGLMNNPGNCNTWTPGSVFRHRPHNLASTPVTTLHTPASPSDSGYRSLPSSASDYQLLKSPQTHQQHQYNSHNNQDDSQSAVRRLSLPASAQTILRASGPKPSPTFHGLPFRPFTCGVSPNGNPIFLGCTHLHNSNSGSSISTTGSTRVSTPATSPAHALTTSQAIQQLLAQPKNGFKIVDDKVSLFIEILDTQERFAKVSLYP
uniref:Uncharacterized protein n=1 Tax=Bracon brevicornis TaxID=1563983 RepID=A0A6V7K3S6_9HYME